MSAMSFALAVLPILALGAGAIRLAFPGDVAIHGTAGRAAVLAAALVAAVALVIR